LHLLANSFEKSLLDVHAGSPLASVEYITGLNKDDNVLLKRFRNDFATAARSLQRELSFLLTEKGKVFNDGRDTNHGVLHAIQLSRERQVRNSSFSEYLLSVHSPAFSSRLSVLPFT
jgi:hypothetical protein